VGRGQGKEGKGVDVMKNETLEIQGEGGTLSRAVPGALGALGLVVVGVALAILVAVVMVAIGGDRVFPPCPKCSNGVEVSCPEPEPTGVPMEEYRRVFYKATEACGLMEGILANDQIYGKSKYDLQGFVDKRCDLPSD